MSTLFISHSSKDPEAARELRDMLEERGHRSVFLDLDPETGIKAGVSWERTLYTKLRACRAVVALCSKNYLDSQWCFAEIALARMEGKDVFALQIDPWSEETRMPSILTREQYVDLRTNRAEGYQRLFEAFRFKGIVPSKRREWGPEDPPYPGLRAFREADAPIFFGRDDETLAGTELLTRVRRQGHPRLVMVLGASGSGKSSLARAGLVPRLRQDEEQWQVVGPFRPGRRPSRELAGALAVALDQAGEEYSRVEIEAQLESYGARAQGEGAEGIDEGFTARRRLQEALELLAGELGPADEPVVESVRHVQEFLTSRGGTKSAGPVAAAEAEGGPLAALAHRLRLASGHPESSVVVVVDQFEELLGHENEGTGHAANRFLKVLRDAVECDDNPPLLLATMRSDYLEVFQRCRALRGVGFKSLPVGPMAREGMRKVIEEPARLGQLQLEKGLTDLLLDDTESSNALPLLAFTLREMWERYRQDRLFEIREYKHLGRLEGAIARVAEETYEVALRDGDETTLRDAFLALARPTEGGRTWARQPASWKELGAARPMLEHFLRNRLLVTRSDGTLEVAHEALFSSWGRLRGWLAANSEALLLRNEIELDAQKWKRTATEADREPFLWRGGRLTRALELRDGGVLALNELGRDFVDASETAEQARLQAIADRQRRELRRARIFAATVGAAFLVAVALFFYARHEERRARDQALVAVASDWLSRDPTRSGLVLLELDDPSQADHAIPLLGAALVGRPALLEVRGHLDALGAAAFSPDGSRILTASTDRTVRLWNAQGAAVTGPDGRPLVLRHPGVVSDVDYSPRGDRFATASFDGNARLFLAGGEPMTDSSGEPLLLEHDDQVNSVAWSPEGDRLVTASDDGTARVWSADGAPVVVVELPLRADGRARLEANSAAFDHGGQRIVTASENGTARVWSASGEGSPVVLTGHQGSVLGAVFSPAGDRLATASRDGTVRLWNDDGSRALTSAGDPVELRHPDQVLGVLFRAVDGGGEILTACNDGRVRRWKADPRGEYRQTTLSLGAVPMRLRLDASGERFVTANVDGSARVWSVDCCGEPIVLPQKSARNSLLDGDQVVTASTDGTVRFRSISSARETEIRLQGHAERLRAIAFDLAASRIVTASRDGTARVWTMDGDPVTRVGGDGIKEPVVLEHDDEVRAAVFDPAGERIATASDDGAARVWNADGAGDPVVERHAAGTQVLSVAWSPDGERVASASDDGDVRVWNADGSPLSGWKGDGRVGSLLHQEQVNAVAWSPTGDRILTATRDRQVWVWSSDGSGQPVRLAGHERSVAAVAWNRAGDRIVTGSYDNTARVWNADGAGEPLVLGGHPNAVVDVAFDSSGERVVTTSLYKDSRVWRVTYEMLAARIRSSTRICLDPEFRRASLGESRKVALSRFESCLSCEESFRQSVGDGKSEGALVAYRSCVLGGWRL